MSDFQRFLANEADLHTTKIVLPKLKRMSMENETILEKIALPKPNSEGCFKSEIPQQNDKNNYQISETIKWRATPVEDVDEDLIENFFCRNSKLLNNQIM